MKLLLYNLLFPLAFLFYLPAFILKLVRRGGFAHHFWERFALYSAEQRQALARTGGALWVHAVSVGEVVAATGFIRRWQARDPGLRFVLSTTTATGHATARRKLAGDTDTVLIYYPVDFFFSVAQALRVIRPRMLVIFEVEYWPNLVCMAARRGVPVALVNGRMSDRSAAGYAKHKWFFADLFGRFSLMCVQSDADAGRVTRVVGDAVPVHVCNTMKFDQVPDADSAGDEKRYLLDTVFGDGERTVWTAGSTHAGEEDLVADVFARLKGDHPRLKLVLVPRHHERAPEAEAALSKRGLSYRLLLPAEGAATSAEPVDVLLVNTTGELMDFYSLSDVVFVGKSLAGNTGGHNIIEPAIFGKPILHGAHMENFRFVAGIFREHEAAIEIADDDALEPALRRLLEDEGLRCELGARARRVVERYRGAIDRTIDLLEEALPPSA